MEAVELSREERAKLAEHREKCAAARKEVSACLAHQLACHGQSICSSVCG